MEFETENALRAWAFRKGLRRLIEKPRAAASDRVVYLAVAPPIEPVIYSKEIFILSDLILMIINRPRPLSVPLSGVYTWSWRLKLICTVSPCRFSGHIPRHLQRKSQRQRVAGSECTWFRLWVTVKGVSKSKCSWFFYKSHLISPQQSRPSWGSDIETQHSERVGIYTANIRIRVKPNKT